MKTICENRGVEARCRRRAFSLIEVTLALGIVSFAFVTLLGLLPVGFNTFTHSIDSATESQIAQAVLTQARQAKFSDLENFSGTRFEYDEQGKAVEAGKTGIYNAQITLKKSRTLDPAQPSAGTGAPTMAIIEITVKKISDRYEQKKLVAYIADNGI